MTTPPTTDREHEEDPSVTAPVEIDHDRALDESMGWLTVPDPVALTRLATPDRAEYVQANARRFMLLALGTARRPRSLDALKERRVEEAAGGVVELGAKQVDELHAFIALEEELR